MKVYSPNKSYTGVTASVPFCKGQGETDDPYLLEWFEKHGYEVEKPKPGAKRTTKHLIIPKTTERSCSPIGSRSSLANGLFCMPLI